MRRPKYSPYWPKLARAFLIVTNTSVAETKRCAGGDGVACTWAAGTLSLARPHPLLAGGVPSNAATTACRRRAHLHVETERWARGTQAFAVRRHLLGSAWSGAGSRRSHNAVIATSSRSEYAEPDLGRRAPGIEALW